MDNQTRKGMINGVLAQLADIREKAIKEAHTAIKAKRLSKEETEKECDEASNMILGEYQKAVAPLLEELKKIPDFNQ